MARCTMFMHYTRLLSCTTPCNKMQPLVSNCPTTTLSCCIMCGALGGPLVIWLLLCRWLAFGLVSLLEIQTYSISGSLHHRVVACGHSGSTRRICGDIDTNMQGIKCDIQWSLARTGDTCVVSTWPTAFLETKINLLISYRTSWKRRMLPKMGACRVNFASVSYQTYLVWSLLLSDNAALGYLNFGPLPDFG